MVKKTKKAAPKASKHSVVKGAKMSCKECGLVVRVVDTCDCGETCDVVCCDEPMSCVE